MRAGVVREYGGGVHPPLVVGLGRIGVTVGGLGPNLPGIGLPAAELAAIACSPGAGVAVALRTAQRLGCRARAAGTVGADLLGQLARSALRESGIEVELLRAAGTSACDLATVAGDGTLRTRYGGDRGEPTPLDAGALLASASALLVDGTDPSAQLQAARAARAAKLPVIFDVAELRDGADQLIAASDILLASEREVSELAPRGELGDALDQLTALGPRAVVITLGAEGAIGRHGGHTVRCAAFPTDVLDAYGAGSVYHGAFAAALLSELAFARCMEVAAAAAALAIRELGPWSGSPSRDEVLALARTRRA